MSRQTRRFGRLLASLLTLPILAAVATASPIYDSGTIETLIADEPGNVAVLDSTGGSPTTLNVPAGGRIGGIAQVADNSTLNLLGGSVDRDVRALGNATVNIAGLSLVTGNVLIADSAQAVMTNGLITGNLSASNNATIEYRGGIVFGGLTATSGGVLEVYGKNFRLNGVPVFGPISGGVGTLSGDLQFRDATGTRNFQNAINLTGGAQIVLVDSVFIPEPAAAATLLLGLMATLRRRLR